MFKLHAGIGDNVTIQEVEQGHYPDGTLMLHLPAAPVSIIEWYYESDAELFTLICLKKHYDQYSNRIVLILPYVPHARMDRVKNPKDCFTLKYFCETINGLKFLKVIVSDVHSNVALALLDRVQQTPIDYVIREVLSSLVYHISGECGHNARLKVYEDLLLFFPDEGAMKRYSDCVSLPYTFGIKSRDWETGRIKGLRIDNPELVAGKNILIIDDICSRGGTFFHSANALKEAGANHIYLYVTHAENTMVEGNMYNTPGLIEHIFTAKTIFNKELDVRNKVTVV